MAARIHGWVVTGERYAENISVDGGALESYAEQTSGVVSLVKEVRVDYECRILPGADVPDLPTYSAAALEILYRQHPAGSQVSLSSLEGTNAITGTTENGDWYVEYGIRFAGYGDEDFATQIYQVTFVSEAVDVKRLMWTGRMTAERFKKLASD